MKCTGQRDKIQMMHGSECDIEIWCTWGSKCRLRAQPKCDISTEGHHILMSHKRPCFICFVVWPTISLKLWHIATPPENNQTAVSLCVVWFLRCVTDRQTYRSQYLAPHSGWSNYFRVCNQGHASSVKWFCTSLFFSRVKPMPLTCNYLLR